MFGNCNCMDIGCMPTARLLIIGVLGALISTTLLAQTLAPAANQLAGKTCILAGRINADQRWAPQLAGVVLLNAQGKRVAESNKKALATVTGVQLTADAQLSQCTGGQAMQDGGDDSGLKGLVPFVRAGSVALAVEAVYFPPSRARGDWVELQLAVPADRLVMSQR